VRSERIYRTEAVVLKGYDFGEADRILTFYTPHVGKLRAIAKGVRRTKSRKAGHLDLFMRSSLLLARGRQLDIVTQAETIESFREMRDDLMRSTYCHYVAELVDAFTGENLANQPVYDLTVTTFRRLATAQDLALAVRSFELQLLGMTGYRPQLRRCLACDSVIEPRINRFSARMGGVLCPDCTAADTAAPAISVSALKLMRHLQSNDGAVAIAGLGWDIHQEVERRLQEYIIYRLESRPRSIAFIEKLRAEQAAT
jgi:DNA repair protein RecO (recombination protein O)